MKLLSKLFTAGRPEPAPAGSAPPPSDPRTRLREAHRALAAAQLLLEQRKADTYRVHALIEAAEAADEALHQAEAKAIEANTRWATAGAGGDLPPEARALIEAAEAARQQAYRAHLQAQGAKAALSRDSGTLLSETAAQRAVNHAKDAVVSAACAVIQEYAESRIQRATELLNELMGLLSSPDRSLAGLAYLRRFNDPASGAGNHPALLELVQSTHHLTNYSHEKLCELMEPWNDDFRALMLDPEAPIYDGPASPNSC